MFADDDLKDFNFEELDNEIGLGELLKQKDNFFISLFKKLIFGVLVIVIGIMVFYASFTIGKVLFLSDKTVSISVQEQALADFDLAEEKGQIEEEIKTTPIVQQSTTEQIDEQAPSVTETKTDTTAIYTLIAGTFGQLENAKKIQTKASVLGYNSEIKSIERNNNTYYRVVVGSFTNIEKANNTKKILDAAGIDSFLDQTIK